MVFEKALGANVAFDVEEINPNGKLSHESVRVML